MNSACVILVVPGIYLLFQKIITGLKELYYISTYVSFFAFKLTRKLLKVTSIRTVQMPNVPRIPSPVMWTFLLLVLAMTIALILNMAMMRKSPASL